MVGCYRWRLVTGTPGWNASAGVASNLVPSYANLLYARLWVLDPSQASQTSQKIPSQTSAELSASFNTLGLFPTITASPAVKVAAITFDASGSYWEFSYNTTSPSSYSLVIDSNHISLMNCFVGSTSIALDVQKFDASTMFQVIGTPSRLLNGRTLKVSRDACSLNVAFAISDTYGASNLILTQTSFTDTVLLRGNLNSVALNDVALAGNSILVLDALGNIFVNGTTRQSAGLPTSGTLVNMLKSASYCDVAVEGTSTIAGHAVAWSDAVGTSSFYMSTDSGLTFQRFSLSEYLQPANLATQPRYRIRDISFSGTYQQYCVLARDETGVDKVFMVDPYTGKVTRGFVFSDLKIDEGVKGATPRIWPLSSAGGEVLFSGDSLYYSPNGGLNIFGLQLVTGTSGTPTTLRENEWIAQVASDKGSGIISVLTNINRMFSGKAGFAELVEQNSGLSESEASYIFFDSLGKLQVLTFPPADSSNLVVKREVEPMLNPSATPCPLKTFDVYLDPLYILDIGENLTIDGSLTPQSSGANSFSVIYTNYSLITAKTSVKEYEDNDPTSNSILEFRLKTLIKPKSSKLKGKTELLIRPASGSIACKNTQASSSVVIGCRPTRKLVFRGPLEAVPRGAQTTTAAASTSHSGHGSTSPSQSSDSAAQHLPPSNLTIPDCSHAPSTYTIPGGYWVQDFKSWTRPSFAKTVNYDCKTYGLPVNAFYGVDFIPNFDLYDDGVFVRTVTADIAMWENDGRDSFGYLLTTGSAGCVKKPQSWIDMAKDFSGAPIDAFGPKNYDPCYVSNSNVTQHIDHNSPYTIFNSTNGNGLIWQQRVDGIFLFTARVLDPTYR
ncbi:hypothetical protein HDU67_009089 [Dinochytrium kinnereticum]|nr:hypothetical protein HDU67_009089 [Dinochytrium kinnereticum]